MLVAEVHTGDVGFFGLALLGCLAECNTRLNGTLLWRIHNLGMDLPDRAEDVCGWLSCIN